MAIGYYAPLPPVRSGVADYAEAMLAVLSERGDVRVNQPGDLNLYHIGNNALHAAIYEQAIAAPGAVLLHDAVLHHLLIGSLGEATYRAEFVYNYGVWAEDLAESLWARRARSMSDPRYFRYPLLKRLAERSLAVVAHSQEARHELLSHCPGTRVYVIPHLNLERTNAAPQPSERERYRREALGIGSHHFLLGIYGHLRETKRIGCVLAALDALLALGVAAKLLVAGEYASDDYARAMAPRLETHPAVLVRGNTGAEEFRALIAAADVCVNLKHPGAGESSGIAVRAMALGVPLILSENAADAPPRGAFVPVPAGPAELPVLIESLAWLAKDPAARSIIARAARMDCLTRRDPRRIAGHLWGWMEEIHATSVA